MISRSLLTSAILILFSATLAREARPAQIDPERGLDEARALYQQGLFDDSISKLDEVIDALERLRDLEEKRMELADAHFLLGLSYVAVRDENSAKENFARTSAFDPTRVLDPEVHAPKVVSLYEEARRDVREPAEIHAPETEALPIPGQEEGPHLGAGTKVRARLGGEDRIVGNLLSVDADTLTLVTEHQRTVVLLRGGITNLEISTGKKGHALWGIVIGAATGALIGMVEDVDENCLGEGCYTKGENISYTAIGMGLVGGLAGALYRTDRWLEVPSTNVRVGVRGTPRGAGVLVTLSF